MALFDLGYEGAANYRIPAIICTENGTLIASADQRVPNAYDSPNDINLVVRRSLDNGKTWEPLQKLVDLPGEGR
ncbi:sialidase family protein, partial [Actinotignum timonense]